MFRKTTVVVAVAASALVACSSSHGPHRASSSPSTSSPSIASPSTAKVAAATRTSTPGRDLSPQLLSATDLPAGWSVDKSGYDSGTLGEPACLSALQGYLRAPDLARADFKKGSYFPAFQESLAYYSSTGKASSTFGTARAVLDRCRDLSFSADGHTYKGSLRGLDFAELGQQSAAWLVTLHAAGYTFGVDVAIVRKGAEVALLLYADFNAPDVNRFTSLSSTAVAKLPAA